MTDPAPLLSIFAMTAKGLAVVRALTEQDPRGVALVVASRDPAVDRDYYDEIRAECLRYDIPFADRADAVGVTTPFVLAVSWRWMIDLRDNTELIVFHDSLLPHYRGFNPLVTAIIAGDREAGVTALLASDEYDRGDTIDHESITLRQPARIAEAIEDMAAAYRTLALRIAQRLRVGDPLAGTPQDESQASYSLWRDDDDYEIDWSLDAEAIVTFIGAVGSPYLGARTSVNGVPARVWEAMCVPDVTIANRQPGKVIFLREGEPVVVCGTGLVRISALTDDATSDSLLPLRRFRSRFGPAVSAR